MNKFISSVFLLAGVWGATGCSSDAVTNAPESAHADITVAVQTAGTSGSRASLAEIDGYELKCIMQLLDADGNMVGQQKTMSAAGGSTAFVITGAEQDAGASSALFWAEYQPSAAGAAKVYNTEDLTDITFAQTEFGLVEDVCDAFAGRLDRFVNNASVTLVRPFACVSFMPENPEKAEGCTSLEVSYEAPSGYNILTGNVESTQTVTLSNSSFDPASAPWFKTYIFGAQNSSLLESEISVKAEGSKTFDLTIAAGKIPTDANYLVNVTGTLTDAATQDVNVSVNIDGNWTNDPNKPVEMTVGSYVNSNGEATANVADAVAVVFYMGALDGDNINEYPAQFAGKTIKAYAVALNNVASARQSFGETLITGLEKTTANNGLEPTASLISKLQGTQFEQSYTAWVGLNSLSGNTSGWYIPSLNQLEVWLHMLYENNKGEAATGSEAFKALFSTANIFDRDPIATVNYASSSINDQGNISGVRMNAAEVPNCQAAGISVTTQTKQTALCRPMFTIFE